MPLCPSSMRREGARPGGRIYASVALLVVGLVLLAVLMRWRWRAR